MNNRAMTARIDALFADGIHALEAARRELPAAIAAGAGALSDALDLGGKILICGNGGSASDSLHFSSELLNKFERVRRPLAAISLAADISTLTSIANDESYDAVFAKQVEALGRAGDILVAITTSGNSPNILQAVRAAQAAGMRCIALNGKDGGELSKALGARDINIIAPARSTARVQEIHGVIIHAFCDLIDRRLFGDDQT
ncbi:MAG: SIS domain-containing protein [Gammaproteobacteria bacterium]